MPTEHAVLDLVSEVGEMAKELLKESNYGRSRQTRESDIALEIGDVIYSLCVIANNCNVDLEDALVTAITKMEQRLARSGSAGSESERRS